MATVAQPTQTYNRIAYHAELRGTYGQAIRDAQGRVWFVSDNDQVTRLSDADIPALTLCGRVDLSAEARLDDLVRGGVARIACGRQMGRA
jgi:hypothetical protein